MSSDVSKKVSLGTCFSVASVWFGSHAGGGFASGNQATQYYVQYGWYAPIMAFLSMVVLGLVLREVMTMSATTGLTSYKEIFSHLYAPYTKLEILFEIYYFIIVICAVSACFAGAGELFADYNIPYMAGIVVVGILTLILVMFGAGLVAKASTVMSIMILIAIAIIYISGIVGRTEGIAQVFTEMKSNNLGTAIWKIFVYAGFQCVVVPAIIGTSGVLKNRKACTKAAFMGILMNGIALALSCVMLLGWYDTGADSYLATNNLAVPTLYVAKQLGVSALPICYAIALCLCFISTSVTSIYGLIPRFQKGLKVFQNMDSKKSAFIIALVTIVVVMLFSTVGLTNVIKYGYNYCGIVGLFVVVIPFLTVGHKKNSDFIKEHPEYKGE